MTSFQEGLECLFVARLAYSIAQTFLVLPKCATQTRYNPVLFGEVVRTRLWRGEESTAEN